MNIMWLKAAAERSNVRFSNDARKLLHLTPDPSHNHYQYLKPRHRKVCPTQQLATAFDSSTRSFPLCLQRMPPGGLSPASCQLVLVQPTAGRPARLPRPPFLSTVHLPRFRAMHPQPRFSILQRTPSKGNVSTSLGATSSARLGVSTRNEILARRNLA